MFLRYTSRWQHLITDDIWSGCQIDICRSESFFFCMNLRIMPYAYILDSNVMHIINTLPLKNFIQIFFILQWNINDLFESFLSAQYDFYYM